MDNKIKASIIIPTKDKITRLRVVLKALESQVNESIEVIVIFDGNNNTTLEAFNKLNLTFQPRTIIVENNKGRSAARNYGINEAKGDIIILMDDDTIPGNDFVAKHLSGHLQPCVLMGVTRDILLSEAEIDHLYFDENTLHDTAFLNRNSHIVNKPIFGNTLFKIFRDQYPFKWLHLFTNNVSLPRKEMLEIGGFDEAFKGWGHEDIELGYRLQKYGLSLKKDFSIVNYHLVHKNNYSQKIDESILNLKYFLKKHRNFDAMTWISILICKENIRKFLNAVHPLK